jgi:hypothetical protein
MVTLPFPSKASLRSIVVQPTPPKPGLWEKIVGVANAIRVFVLPAKGLGLLEETGWQRGKRQASDFANRRGILFMIVCAPIFAVGGSFFALNGFSWLVRVVLAALIGLGVAVAAAFSIAGYYALRAPYKQRTEAREYAHALEAHARAYAEWARRRELAKDFKWDTFEDGRRLLEAEHSGDERLLMGSVADEDARWRSNVASVRGQLLDSGASNKIAELLDAQLTALDAKEDGYGDNEIRRLAFNMLTACQNLHEEIRSQDLPPTPPTPPTIGSGP